MQRESKKIIYHRFTSNWKNSKTTRENGIWIFLDRMGYPISLGLYCLKGRGIKQASNSSVLCTCFWTKAQHPPKIPLLPFKLKNWRKELKIWNNANMTSSKKQVESWEPKMEMDKDTIIKKIWEAGRNVQWWIFNFATDCRWKVLRYWVYVYGRSF